MMTKRNTCAVVILILLLQTVTRAQPGNIALGKPVTASSAAVGFPASNIVDGKISRNSKWEAANGKAPHVVEIDLQKYYSISELRVHTGLLDSEKKPEELSQAAGFWSAKNFKLQYWDDANWSDFPGSEVHENRLASVIFHYKNPVITFRIRLVCDDGEPINIMEIEAIGIQTPNMPAPPTLNSSVPKSQQVIGNQEIDIKVSKKMVGRSMKYVGYNQGYYMPGSNVSGWLEYSNVNSLRVWATLNSFVPATAVQVDKQVNTVEEFDRRKNELRIKPEDNAYIKWKQLMPLYETYDTSSTNGMVLDYAFAELKRLGIDVILQVGSTDFDSTWTNKWKQWQRYYALAFHAAKVGDVTMFAMQNEPNHRNSGPMKLDQWIMGMQVVSDAIHCAIADVNRLYGKQLVAKMVGPVTAGNNPEWWSAIAQNIRTDYHGNKLDHDLMEIFSTHSYNSPAAGYETRINSIRKIIMDNHPEGKPLPIVYTEIGRWMNAYLIDKEETMDSPSLFTEWAGIYTNNMKNGGYGMWAFKFANTASDQYPRGIKSGHHFIWQGRRIVEDAYKNLAYRKPVRTSNNSSAASLITDGKKTAAFLMQPDSLTKYKWIEIDLGKKMSIASAAIYTGSEGGVYTGPDRVKLFRLQYQGADGWEEIPGTQQKDNKYTQVFLQFKPVTTQKVRMEIADQGIIKIREIKIFAEGDGPGNEPDFNVSGIQRTGEVVRLFAKGFKNERPLFETTSSVKDVNLDAQTAYDSTTGNYYMWLVQRGNYTDRLSIDLSGLSIEKGTVVTAEAVGPAYYGEVAALYTTNATGKIMVELPPSTVLLLTIPAHNNVLTNITAAADATVSLKKMLPGGQSKDLEIALDAQTPSNNRVSYIRFQLPQANKTNGRAILKVYGRNATDDKAFRFHIYAMESDPWNENELDWSNAPALDKNEALVHHVGQTVYVAGELAMDHKAAYHYLDVSAIVQKLKGKQLTFVLVRETRQLGDDDDKGKKVIIGSRESASPPSLMIFKGN